MTTPNESPSTEATPVFPGRRGAVILGMVLLAALGVALLSVLRDNARRSTLEVVQEASSLDDNQYVFVPQPPPAEPPFPVLAHLNGKPLYAAGYKRHTKLEAEMQRVARDEATGLTIYQAPVKAKEAGDPPTYFLKLGPGEFLKVRP